MSRPQLRHPPTTPPPPVACPLGIPFASRWLALGDPGRMHSTIRLDPVRCATPGCGWHLAHAAR